MTLIKKIGTKTKFMYVLSNTLYVGSETKNIKISFLLINSVLFEF